MRRWKLGSLSKSTVGLVIPLGKLPVSRPYVLKAELPGTLPGDGRLEVTRHLVGRLQYLLPLPLPGAFDYRVPEGLELAPGAFVSVPFGRREAIGVVWSCDAAGDVAEDKLGDKVGEDKIEMAAEKAKDAVDKLAD